jgi:hypothetical protein
MRLGDAYRADQGGGYRQGIGAVSQTHGDEDYRKLEQQMKKKLADTTNLLRLKIEQEQKKHEKEMQVRLVEIYLVFQLHILPFLSS